MRDESEQCRSLYQREEHDACGVGFVAQLGQLASHRVIEQALECLANLTHRGGVDADGASGDGAGILIQLPTAFFEREALHLDPAFPPRAKVGVGVFFFPRDAQARAMSIAEQVVVARGLRLAGWREVPIDESVLGQQARETQPAIWLFSEPGL